MTLWVVCRVGPRVEARVLSIASNWYISTKSSGPVNGEVQDSTIGCNELTRSTVVLDKAHAMAMFTTIGGEPPRFDLKPSNQLYTGREIVSILLRGTPIDYRRSPSSFSDVYAPYIPYDPSETLTVIERGQLIRGVLDKESIGAKKRGSIFHLIGREYGSQRALDAIFDFQQVSLRFLEHRGFTVGMADLLVTPEASTRIRELIEGVVLESNVITSRLLRGEIVPPIDSTVRAFYERLQIAALKVPEADILRWVLGSIKSDTNGFFRMIATGAKGNNPNLIHVAATIGQTTINGERIREQFAFRRTLPYFPRFATDPAAYGYVRNCYMSGMTAVEFICQDMNGRYDLINKALSTASTGYFMRKGVMNNQSSLVDNMRRVVKDTRVVQFIYGEDGLDPRELEPVDFWIAPLSDAALTHATTVDFRGAEGPSTAEAKAAVDEAVAHIRRGRDAYRAAFLRLEAANFGQPFSTRVLMPLDARRLVEGVLTAARDAAGGKVVAPTITAKGLIAALAQVDELIRVLPYAHMNEIAARLRKRIAPHRIAAAALLAIHVRSELSPRVVATLTGQQLDYIIDSIRLRYSRALISYGTAVGISAAQAISEPLTQYMLDSHHRSVAGGTNTAGLTRVREIYSTPGMDPADEQSSAMILPLRPEALGPAAGAAAVAQEIANSIEFVTLRGFTRAYDILLEPPAALVYPPFTGDATWMAEFERSHPLIRASGDLSNWCLRFSLDKSALVLKAVELELIIRRLLWHHAGSYIVHTAEAVPEIVIRIWLRANVDAATYVEKVLDTPIRGIEGILGARAARVTRHIVAADGALKREEIHVVSTVGTNLFGGFRHSAVDPAGVISTSVGDTARMFGIEAARSKIISETRAFMEDNTPNLRHLQLYADEMTRTGRVTSVERGGLGVREPANVFLRMAYGAPIQAITNAALAGATSRVYGLAAPLMLGAIPQIGSLYNSLVVNEEFVRSNTKSVDSVLDSL